jgi:ubiquinone/menaquinone biosynthesis C-methylase UbiE
VNDRKYDTQSGQPLISIINSYWENNIHDLAVTAHPVGTPGFFLELDAYRYDKLQYLPRWIDFSSFRGMKLLEVGCGLGTDLVHFAGEGAQVTGVDLSKQAIELAQRNFEQHDLQANLYVMNGEKLEFPDEAFEVVYCHSVLQYTTDPEKMVAEIYRVLKPGGKAILVVYNKKSWLNLLSWLTKVPLEHEDAPVLRKFTIGEFRQLLEPFSSSRIISERFPVKTRLHSGIKGKLYNTLFVPAFSVLPKFLVRPFGWHLLAIASK